MFRLALALAISVGSGATAQEAVTEGKQLYASAAYDEALATFGRIEANELTRAEREAVDEYRMFCLVALDRSAEAESVAESLVSQDPLFHLDPGEVSPRIEAMFAEVRKRLLPGLIRSQLREARAEIERKDFAAAEPRLVMLMRVLDDEPVDQSDEALADFRVLVGGFLTIVRTPHEPIEVRSPVPSPTVSQPKAATPRIYTAGDPGVVAPVTTREGIAVRPGELFQLSAGVQRTPVLEVLIDESGKVQRASLREPINPAYDSLVLRAAREWRYRPATVDGIPVKYLKIVAIKVKP